MPQARLLVVNTYKKISSQVLGIKPHLRWPLTIQRMKNRNNEACEIFPKMGVTFLVSDIGVMNAG